MKQFRLDDDFKFGAHLKNFNQGASILLDTPFLAKFNDDPAFVSRADKHGAMGYLSKNSAADSLVRAIESVLAGRPFFSAEIASKMVDSESDYASPTLSLSNREFEVFRLLAEGRGVAEIADDLNLSPKTVSNHRSNLMDKLSLKSTAELVLYAVRQGVIEA